MYVGLIVCQGVYGYRFMLELIHLLSHANTISETDVMLSILGMIDVVMVANLLYMVIVGGYETFVSKLHPVKNHPDRPDWLGHIDANLLKVKLAVSLITISSVHLLKTFINADKILETSQGINTIIAQFGIHLAFLVSAVCLAYIDKMMDRDDH